MSRFLDDRPDFGERCIEAVLVLLALGAVAWVVWLCFQL